MNWFDKFERRFHNFGIPGLIRIIALLQAVVFVMLLVKPEFLNALVLDANLIKEGQVWRVLTFCLIPRTMSVIWILFAIMLLIFIGDALESAWGAFRVTLYYFVTVAMLLIAGWIHPMPQLVSAVASHFLYLSLFLAFALTFPHLSLNLYGILPVQVRWLGWLDLAYLAYTFYTTKTLRMPIGLSMIPFLLIAIPSWYRNTHQKIRVMNRRSEFDAARLPDLDHFHKCSVCGRTDVSNPELEFRVMADGTERCGDHLSA